MLTGVKVLLLGGDARQLEVIHKLCELNAQVTVCGFDQRKELNPRAVAVDLEVSSLEDLDALILPAVGPDDDGFIQTVFSSESLQLTKEYLLALPKHCTIYTGIAKSYLKQLCNDGGYQLVELFERDDVAIYNSIPTAEGALMMAIQHTDITIHRSNSMVLGFGRTGITMARTLQALGSNVYFGVRRSEQYARAYEMGFNPFYTKDLEQFVGNIDLLFNTIPTMIITAQIIEKLQKSTVIIDLATKPGGTDFHFAEERGMKALLAPGLPGIVAPRTAGLLLADCLSQLIHTELTMRRDLR
ncbi:MAG: dipicolinate synthase subunit DpsA [Candidatus Pristimantibacillus lignocellulolyticus]|uniref:Dipicolinate synthase subunit DpsA n=1 Tax=Candidatus Pristimantibacillus lignocellulolyticus TaxID=2994561 RepID=A0A9J6ZBE0_9BACL|nr:MAG: dipicolinate synthase subunit DpsA [Candidatus Pristimantibacillus lignocellulolyticus]